MQSRHWVTRVTSHATLGADPGDLTSAATQMSTLGTSLPQQTTDASTQVKGDIEKLMMFKKPSILDGCEYVPNITNVQLCFLNFLVMPRISTAIDFMRFCYAFQASEFEISWYLFWIFIDSKLGHLRNWCECVRCPPALVMVQPG